MLIGPRVNLVDAKLESAVLPRANLAGADLSNADLSNADLVGANLSGANLSRVTGTNADLQGADLSGAALSSSQWLQGRFITANLGHARFTNAVLTGATLYGASVAETNFSGADLRAVGSGSLQGVPSALPAGWHTVRGYLAGPGAALGGADLRGAQLASSNLSQAILTNADLQSADLSSGSLNSATLANARFAGANLSNQSLTGAKISKTELDGSTLDGSTGSSLGGAPASLPNGWAVANGQLQVVPSGWPESTNVGAGQWIESRNGQFTVNMQSDGNLVEYQGGTAVWATGTGGGVQTVMQDDCNFVIYRAGQLGQPSGALYTTGTGGAPDGNCTFAVADDGAVLVATSNGTVRWERYANGTIFTHRIQMSQDAPMYAAPSSSSGQVGSIPKGDSPGFVCWTTGPPVGGVDVYFYVLWQNVAGYYPSYYDNSVYSTDARISIDYGIPRCGSVPTTFTPPSNGAVAVVGPDTISAPIEVTVDTNIRPGPSTTSGSPLTTMPAGSSPGYLCWTTGEVINTVDVWFKVYWSGSTGYYASGLDNSSYASDVQITSKYGIPSCGGDSPAVTAPVQPPVIAPSATASGPYVSSLDPDAPYAWLRSCPDTRCDYVVDDATGLGVWLPNGTPVTMECWEDGGSSTVPGHTSSNRWFAVYWQMADWGPRFAWVFSNLVANQARVPSCEDLKKNNQNLVDAFPTPNVGGNPPSS